MSIIKKAAFLFFIIAALVAAMWGYYAFRDIKQPARQAITVFPDSCLLYGVTADFASMSRRVSSQSIVMDRLRALGKVNEICNNLHLLDSLATLDPFVSEELHDNPVHFAIYRNGWLAAFNALQQGHQRKLLEGIIKPINAVSNADGIYSCRAGHLKFFVAVENGIAILSSNPGLLENALKTGNNKLTLNKEFSALYESVPVTGLPSLFINHSLINAASDATTPFLTGQSGGIVDILPSELKMNGILIPGSNDVLADLHGQEPVPVSEVMEVISRDVSAFSAFAPAKLEKTITRNKDNWRPANENAMYNCAKEFSENAGRFLCKASSGEASIIILEINDTAKADEQLAAMCSSLVTDDLNTLTTRFPLFAPYYNDTCSYVRRMGFHLLFCSSSSELATYCADLSEGKIISGKETFSTYANNNFPSEVNYLSYEVPARYMNNATSMFRLLAAPAGQSIKDFRHSSISIVNEKSGFGYRVHLEYNRENKPGNSRMLWLTDLQDDLTGKPFHFTNHVTGETEIVVQDNSNTLYLLNAKGNILWKKKIDSQLTSEVFNCDIFKNKKFQMLFSTNSRIYLIDRNGKDVQGFPIILPAKATSPLSVVDYDGDRDYRFFIACEDKKLYNYSSGGGRQEGFSTVELTAPVHLPVKYVKVGASDYLVTIDVEGKIYTFSRKGLGRIGLRNTASKGCSGFYVDATSNINTTRIIYADPKNNCVSRISFADKKESFSVDRDIAGVQVSFAQVDENEQADILTRFDNNVEAFNFSGERLFHTHFGNGIGAHMFYADESRKLLIGLNDQQKLSVLDMKSDRFADEDASGLPLIIDLFRDSKRYMIIPFGNTLRCVLID